jgi:hypothetical protein
MGFATALLGLFSCESGFSLAGAAPADIYAARRIMWYTTSNTTAPITATNKL